jgi:hypothetical protein
MEPLVVPILNVERLEALWYLGLEYFHDGIFTINVLNVVDISLLVGPCELLKGTIM